MDRSMSAPRAWPGGARLWVRGFVGLVAAVGVALLLAQALLSPPARDLRALALYLAVSGAATMLAGALALRAADRAAGVRIETKAFLGAAIGSGVALLNVLIVAQLMFFSTAHDLRLLVALIAFGAVVTIVFSLWVSAMVAGRIDRVAAGISNLAAGRYDGRIQVSGGDQVTRLADDVNELAVRLATAEGERRALEAERRELTAAVSHDLRTPLASVRAMVEALADGVVDDPVEVERYYGVMRREIDRLSRMIDDLFELAQLDAGALRLDRQPLDLREIAAEVVDAMQAQARLGGVSLELHAGELTPLPLDGARIERAIANLVRNALDHTPAGGRVSVALTPSGSVAEVRVADSGEGIEAADLPYIWNRFYRAEKSRRRRPGVAGGAGLGLAIVRGIVEAHGGSVHVASAPGAGATFTLRLPATR